ncbi:MAG: hypothetical protein QW707_09100 [Candidatus Bathyarchaeia archaeon]
MSARLGTELRKQRERNRILVTTYVYDAVFRRPIPNSVLAKTSLYRDYRYYERVRDALIREGLITLHDSTKNVEITDKGKHVVISLLTGRGASSDVPLSRIATMFYPFAVLRISDYEREALFATFLLMYADAGGDSSRSYHEEILRSAKEDIENDTMDERLRKASYIISYNMDIDQTKNNLIVTNGYSLICKWSYLLILYYTFRKFSKLARFLSKTYYILTNRNFKNLLFSVLAVTLLTLPYLPNYLSPQHLLAFLLIEGGALISFGAIIGLLFLIIYSPVFVYVIKISFKLLRQRLRNLSKSLQ